MITSSFAGFVLNNKNGNRLIKNVREMVKSRNVCVRLFARNKNRKQFAKDRGQAILFSRHLPVEHATHYGVYIYNDHKKATRCTPEDISYAKGVFDALVKTQVLAGKKINP